MYNVNEMCMIELLFLQSFAGWRGVSTFAKYELELSLLIVEMLPSAALCL